MALIRKDRLRSIGGVIGVVVAVAGGFGAAVGYYTLPDPLTAGIHAHAYARVDQRAIAVWRQDNPDGSYIRVYIEARRGASSYVPVEGSPNTSTSFQAIKQTCSPEGDCSEQYWDDSDTDAFQFDPAMGSASFDGEVAGCLFDVTWTADGLVAPFAGVPHLSGYLAPLGSGKPYYAGVETDNGFAEVSRVAPAQINQAACLFSTTPQTANGFLSQGLQRHITHAGVHSAYE